MNDERRPEPPFDEQPLRPPGLEERMDPEPKWEAPDYRAAGKLEGKRALITGGDSGIGRSVAWLFAREGADVAITCLSEERADAEVLADRIEDEGQKARIIEVDLRKDGEAARAVSEAVDALGGLDILVNNAAFQNHVDAIDDLDVDQFDRTFETNIRGYFLVTKAALKHLPDGGAIINTGSITGLKGSGGLLDYSATKGAIHAFTKALAQQLAGRRIRVNCVAPGPVWTPLNPAERDTDEVESFGESQPWGRPAQPEEIAPAYVYFASRADSGYVTGEVLALLGGETRAA